MNTKTKAMILVLAIGGAALTGGSAANAVTRGAEGGTWSYGVGRLSTYSDYYHPRERHGSTARNGYGMTEKAWGISRGRWSHASVARTKTGNTAYFHRS
ncbi:lactococcin 972 family bacteriocin [Leucobacter sp. cx-328]|uniref:lactococcin 972 family bacteriocin n=1 Tax=unclassified Leucobacter TaxID=2621730 RepID=UPI00165D32C8|nr:lactococcin 972 family bacteriocin [Leucobacter sp. cx-328]MBC9953207.1 lactococcin 972 family bacteriocin [Leucobacter sp. cx-42]